MKFSSVLSIFLAGLSIASPLGQPQESHELGIREDETENYLARRAEDKISDEYKKVQAAHSSLKNGQNYAFSVTCESELNVSLALQSLELTLFQQGRSVTAQTSTQRPHRRFKTCRRSLASSTLV